MAERANTKELWLLFENTDIQHLLESAEKAESDDEEIFFNTMFNLKLQERQQEIINQDKFVM